MKLIDALIAKRQCLAIMGPTASGKSHLSMLLAKELPIEIISVDSALIYRQMDIGTAKPSAEEMQQVRHHLINTHDPLETYSASDFVEDVKRLVDEIFARQKLPVLVGGTMMYFNALQKGMSDLPSAHPEIRADLQRQWDENPEALHAELKKIDAESAERIHQNDPQRLIRALEVYRVTGKTLTEFRAQPKTGLPDFELVKVALIPADRARLHQQIKKRFLQMLEAGFLLEMQTLYSRGDLDIDMTSMRSVGYRQGWMLMTKEYDHATFVEKSLVATRQLAKRQLTWLRKEQDVFILDPYKISPEECLASVLQLLREKI